MADAEPFAAAGYYDALIAAWNNSAQPPPGVTGTGLVAGDSTDAKIVKVNGWTIVGQIPASFFVTADQLANCVAYAEFKVLTAVQQSNLLNLFNISGPLLGGSANTSLLVVGMIIDYFPSNSTTISNLTKLAKAAIQPWWQAPVANNGGGLAGPVSLADTQAAGLT